MHEAGLFLSTELNFDNATYLSHDLLFFQYEEEYGIQNLDLYYDSPSQWARVYGKRSDLKSCAEKESVLQVSCSNTVASTLTCGPDVLKS